MPSLPLSGISVLDATQGVAGPHAGLLLARNGATVTKLEPLDGDWGRTLGKRYGDLSAQAITFNRGKKSIAVDLKKDEGKKLALKMAVAADIVLESYRPGVMSKLGLGYDDIKAHRADVIYLSITGFGQSGPYSNLPVTDSIIQAFSGWMTLHRDAAGIPMRSGIIAIDVMTGLYAYQAISSALLGRFRFGGGKYIDCSMLQSAAAFQAAKVLEFYLEEGQPQVSYVPVGVMPTADGYINISAMRDAHYEALCQVIGRQDLASNPKYSTRDGRREHKDELMALLHDAFARHPTAYLEKELTAAGVMNARINTFGDLLADTHVKEIATFDYVEHGPLGRAPAANIPGAPAFTTDAEAPRCPAVGEHTHELLAALGYDREAIARLERDGVVKQA